MSAQKPDEYGMVVYDIPQGNQNLYQRIWHRIRRNAIRINLSVYLIPWGYRAVMQDIIEDAMEATGQKATFSILKYDKESQDEVEALAREQLNREVIDTMKRLQVKAQEYLEQGKELPKRYLNTVNERLESAKALSVIFGLTQDVNLSMKAALDVFNAQMDILNAKEEERKEREIAQSEASAGIEPTKVEEVVVADLVDPVVVDALEKADNFLNPPVIKYAAGSYGSVMPADLSKFISNVCKESNNGKEEGQG